MTTPALTPSVQTPPIPQGAGGGAVPSTAPARSGQRDGGNSLGTFGVRPFCPILSLSYAVYRSSLVWRKCSRWALGFSKI
jgi:hypothetical protein